MHIVEKNTKKQVKTFWYMVLATGIVSMLIFSLGFVNPKVPEPKKYKLELTLEEINATIGCIEQSNAPAATANAIIKIIAGQVNPQLQAEQKVKDSLDKSKTKPKQ